MRSILLAILLLVAAQPALAGFTEGQTLYLRNDFAGARAHWSEAAAQGDVRAQYALGVLYWRGLGAPADAVAATRWFAQAARRGYRPALDALAALAAELGDAPVPNRAAGLEA